MSERLDLEMCCDCEHWHREVGSIGFCDRYPPSVVVTGSATQQHPRVRDNDHCAEWSLQQNTSEKD